MIHKRIQYTFIMDITDILCITMETVLQNDLSFIKIFLLMLKNQI